MSIAAMDCTLANADNTSTAINTRRAFRIVHTDSTRLPNDIWFWPGYGYFHCNLQNYFPIQKVVKIRLRMSSAVVAPVIASTGASAA